MKQSVVVFYALMIVELSRSLYVKENAYECLKSLGMEYLVSFKCFSGQGRDLTVVFDEVLDWVDHLYKLFRAYSMEYLYRLFVENEKETQTKGKPLARSEDAMGVISGKGESRARKWRWR